MAIAIDWDVKHQLKQTQLMLFLQADLIKMCTSLCDVTMTLKRQEKFGKIYFLKPDTVFYKKMFVDTFTQKLFTIV